MTSKEAFIKIMEIYGDTNSLEGTYDLFLKIKQDLERLEVLEQSNNTLATITGNQLATIHNLIEENEKLKTLDDERIELIYDLNIELAKIEQENEKLKKVIEFLKPIRIDESTIRKNVYCMRYSFDSLEITKEQYELLKEVLNNEL